MLIRLFAVVFCSTILLETVAAQEPWATAPVEEHKWLQRFEGTWTVESKGTMGPGQPEMHCKGTMTCRTLGGFWIMNEWNNEMQGASVLGIQTIGYDPARKKYVGTWVDNMMNHMWQLKALLSMGRN